MLAARTQGIFRLGSPSKRLGAAVAVKRRLACSVGYGKGRILTTSPLSVALRGKAI